MSLLPNLGAPDGFELAVFARSMLTQLPAASAPASFEEAVLQKSTGVTAPQTIQPARRLGMGWKATVASVLLLATVGSVTWFTGAWTGMGITSSTQIEKTEVPLTNLPTLPVPQASVPLPDIKLPDIKKAPPAVRAQVVKRGKVAVNNASQAVAGYPPGQ